MIIKGYLWACADEKNEFWKIAPDKKVTSYSIQNTMTNFSTGQMIYGLILAEESILPILFIKGPGGTIQ